MLWAQQANAAALDKEGVGDFKGMCFPVVVFDCPFDSPDFNIGGCCSHKPFDRSGCIAQGAIKIGYVARDASSATVVNADRGGVGVEVDGVIMLAGMGGHGDGLVAVNGVVDAGG